MSYALRGLGWLMDDYANLGLMDSDALTTKALCGNAKATQQALKDQGFYNGAVDGILGSGSVTAIKNFSIAAGIGSKSWPDAAFCAALKTGQEKKLAAAWLATQPPPGSAGGGTDPGDQGGGYIATPDQGVVGVSQPGTSAPGGQSGSTTAAGVGGLSKKTMLLAGAGVLGVIGIGCLVYAASKDSHPAASGDMTPNRRGRGRRGRKAGRQARRSSRRTRRAARRSSRRASRRLDRGSSRGIRLVRHWATL